MKIPVSLCLAMVFAGVAQDAAAYKGKEHAGLSEVALAVALSSSQLGAGELSKIRAAFLECANAGTKGKREIGVDCIPFGELTKGPDLVFHVQNLVPDPLTCLGGTRPEMSEGLERCREGTVRACKGDLRERLERQGADQDREVFRFAAGRLDNKARSLVNRLLAAHRNTSHFEACAAGAYNRLHRLAIQQARERSGGKDWWLLPLATEAIALHFLQDSFPPGHLLTPRTSTPDLLSRGLHNRINAEGAVAFVENAPSLMPLRQALAGDAEARRWLVERLGLEEPAVDALLQAAAPGEPTFYGDGSLGMKMPDATLALVLLSARSIADVLAAGPGSSAVRIDFTPWCGDRNPHLEDRPVLEQDTLRRPGLDVRTESESLAGYRQGKGYDEDEKEDFNRWVGLRLELAAGAMASTEGGEGRRAEIAFVGGFSGSNDVALCDELGKPTSEFFQDKSLHGFSMALNLRLEKWESTETEVQAATLLVYPWLGRVGLLHLNSYLAAELGAERYHTRTHSADLPTWGGRFGIGLGLVFVELGVKRGHAEKPSGGLRNDTSISLGFRVQPLR